MSNRRFLSKVFMEGNGYQFLGP